MLQFEQKAIKSIRQRFSLKPIYDLFFNPWNMEYYKEQVNSLNHTALIYGNNTTLWNVECLNIRLNIICYTE